MNPLHQEINEATSQATVAMNQRQPGGSTAELARNEASGAY